MDYSRKSHVKYHLSAHIILVTKYRIKLFQLYPEMAEYTRQIINNTMAGIEIIELEFDKDHLHLLINYNPSMAVGSIVKLIKQHTTYLLWQRYISSLKSVYWRRKIIWSNGYFVSSTGQVSSEIIKNYIKNQG